MSKRNAYFHGKRVSRSHLAMLEEAERRGILTHINQGRRTLKEQAAFYAIYLRDGHPKAAFPAPNAPHIKAGHEHHALDIDDGVVDKVALLYHELGVPTAFNVLGEPWHMDTLDEGALIHAAGSLRGQRGILATLTAGTRHADVLVLRRRLRAAGYYDGSLKGRVYGPLLRGRVKAFQRDNYLTADGVVTRRTWDVLMAARQASVPSLSDAGVKFISTWEGFRERAYEDAAGNATIGFGTLLHMGPLTEKDRRLVITREEAMGRLLASTREAQSVVRDRVLVPLAPHEVDALVSFIYNIGIGAFRSSTLLKHLNAGRRHAAADQFLRWNRAGGKVVDGLTQRRKAERALFLKAR